MNTNAVRVTATNPNKIPVILRNLFFCFCLSCSNCPKRLFADETLSLSLSLSLSG
ncbi:MAG: hypothetical protein LBQ02_00130 [Candidatus Nomurabacteria bacterium]|nr:hypothetical protein [Candidatus Nomurabacteria bacterium]